MRYLLCVIRHISVITRYYRVMGRASSLRCTIIRYWQYTAEREGNRVQRKGEHHYTEGD